MSHEWAKKAVEHKLYSMREVQEAEKQARAKVLAAVFVELGVAKAYEKEGRSMEEAMGINRVFLGIEARLKRIQPAAKHLKELLRNEREPLLDVLRDAPPPANISSPHGQILELDNAMFHRAYFDWYKKARAILAKERE